MSESTAEVYSPRNHRSCRWQNRDWEGNWGPMNIAAMVLGFIIFWPIGLAVLFYNLFAQKGDFSRAVRTMKGQWRDMHDSYHRNGWQPTKSGNFAFDEYRAETLRRLDEERRRLEEEIEAFRDFQEELKRKRDRDEFDRFMDSRRPRSRPADE